jgi:hypothetical protein
LYRAPSQNRGCSSCANHNWCVLRA